MFNYNLLSTFPTVNKKIVQFFKFYITVFVSYVERVKIEKPFSNNTLI